MEKLQVVLLIDAIIICAVIVSAFVVRYMAKRSYQDDAALKFFLKEMRGYYVVIALGLLPMMWEISRYELIYKVLEEPGRIENPSAWFRIAIPCVLLVVLAAQAIRRDYHKYLTEGIGEGSIG